MESVIIWSATGLLAYVVQQYVPDPYMDEVFHIRQTQQYCQGNFDIWDDKITTPPGLYLISTGLAKLLTFVLGGPEVTYCNPFILRQTNVFFGVLTFQIILLLSKKLHQKVPQNLHILNALTLTLFPCLFFFNFLYYTDPGSTFFVLLAYYFAISRHLWLSSIAISISLFFRQTNFIWLLFIVGICIRDELARINSKKNDDIALYDPCAVDSQISYFVQSLVSFIVMILSHFSRMVRIILPFLLPLVMFMAFIIWNRGIVLGDKSNHIASLHFPQLFYFAVFTFAFSFPDSLDFRTVKHFINVLKIQLFNPLKLLRLVMAVQFCKYLIEHYTIEHPFLLADNRHYTFYLWKNIFRQYPDSKYWAIPFYWFSAWHLWNQLSRRQSILWSLIYFTSLCLVLIPTPLIEFRYFILPFLFYRLHVDVPSSKVLIFQLIGFVGLNLLTLYVFVFRHFTWSDHPDELQRFMW